MANNLLKTIRYMVSSEDSRPEIKDYWNSVFLAEKAPLNRTVLEASKVFFIVTLSFGISLLMASF